MVHFDKGKGLLQLLNKREFAQLCRKWDLDKGVRKFTTWHQVCTHVAAFLLRLESYREIEAVLHVPRSTFSDANAKRCAGFFQELCDVVLGQIKSSTKNRRLKKSLRNLLAVDASECKVHGSLAAIPLWSQKNNKSEKNMASLKLHCVWNIGNEWVEDFRITPGNTIDGEICKQFVIKAGHTYVFDRAYNHLDLWWKIIRDGAQFVTRLKNCPARTKHRDAILKKNPNTDGVLWEGLWNKARKSRWRHPQVPNEIRFRHIIYRDPETKKVFDFVASNFHATPQEIADIYKKRWAI